MEFFLVCAIFAIACTFAIRGAARGVGNAYRKRMKAWRKKNKNASNLGLRMAMLGQALAMIRFGPRAMWTEGREQFKVGWDIGLDWAKKHGYHPDDRLDLDEDDLLLDEDDLLDEDEEDDERHDRRRNDPDDDRPELAKDDTPFYTSDGYRDDPGFNDPMEQTAPKPAPRPTPRRRNLQLVKPEPVSIRNAQGGPPMAVDVSTPEQLLIALKQIRDNAAADRDDADTAVKRDEDELKNVDAIIARVTDLKFDPKHIAIVQSLRDPCAAALAAANARKSAADAKYIAADKAVTMAQKHMQLQAAGAAGPLYQGD